LLVHDFTNDDIEYLQGIGLNLEILYSDIDHMLEDGSTRDEIMAGYREQQNEAVEGSEENAVQEGEDIFIGADEQKDATMGGKRNKRKGRINKTTRKLRKSKNVRKSRKGRKMRKTKRRGAK
jgi:hypothetical protein